MKKKYIILCNSAEIGGAETMCVIIANKIISKKNSEVFFICYQNGRIFKRLDQRAEIKILSGKNSFQKAYSLNKFIKHLEGDLTIVSVVTGLNFIAALNIIHHKIFKNFDFYRSKNICLYSWEVNNLRSRKITKIKYLFNIFKLNIISLFSKKLICISRDIFDEFRRFLIYNKNLNKIGCPVYEMNPKIKEKLEISITKQDYIISISRHHPQKDLLLLVDIFYRLIKFGLMYKLHIYGEFNKNYTYLLRKKIKELNLESKVILFQPVTNIISAIKGAKFMLHTAAWEGLGNSLIESIYNGTPVVALNCPGGIKDYLRTGENGILINSRNADIIAETIISKNILLNKLKSSNMKETIIEYEANYVLDQLFNED